MVITSQVRVGLAGCLLIVASVSTQAQEATPGQTCSGLGCLFSSHDESQPAPAPPAPAVVPAGDLSPVADLDASAVKKAAKPAPPVQSVTIAAGPAEMARLKALASVMPKSPVRFVHATSDAADFKVAPTLDGGSGDHKIRLFTEQMHIVASKAVRSVADLKGKIVSFGPADSPTRAAAREAFKALDVPVQETPLDFDNALDGLATGDIDAVVVLAPQPSEMLKKVKAPGLHLVAWPEGGLLPSGASTSAIDGSKYPHLAAAGESIRAVGVDAVLAMSARGTKQPGAKSFFAAMSQRSAALSRRGFDLLKADLDARGGRRVASVDRR